MNGVCRKLVGFACKTYVLLERGSRQRTTTLLSLLSLVILSGCSIHPVHGDVTGLRTVDLVNRIRCETRLAIQDKAIMLLEARRLPHSTALAASLRARRGQYWTVERRTLPREEREFYDRYIRTGIAYDFTFNITEENKAVAAVDPVRLTTNGSAGVGLDATGTFNRNNSRHFVMSDQFGELLYDKDLERSDRTRYQNFAYPVAGDIGMFELIDTFIDLNEGSNLTQLVNGNSRVFTDTLAFKTTIFGSVSPHVVLSPVGNRWGLANPTGFTASGERVDEHRVLIGLSMDGPAGNKLASGAVFGLGAGRARSALQKSGNLSPTEQGALDAVQQQRLDNFYDRFGTIQSR